MNRTKTHVRVRTACWVLLLLLGVLGAGCRTDPNDAFIQGYWSFANEFNDPRSTELHVLQEWWFGSGRFFFQQEVAAGFPVLAEGRYRILESEGDQLILELYQVTSTSDAFTDNSQVILSLDREHDTLRINRTLYNRSG